MQYTNLYYDNDNDVHLQYCHHYKSISACKIVNIHLSDRIYNKALWKKTGKGPGLHAAAAKKRKMELTLSQTEK